MAEFEKPRNRLDSWIIDKFRPFAKSWFEIIRNAFVVALLNYVASRSESNPLKLFAFFTYIIFICYCMSFILLSQEPSRSSRKNKYLRWAEDIFWSLVAGVFSWYWIDVIIKAIDQLTKVQFK